jgi:uncharacterized membrane protein YgcG
MRDLIDIPVSVGDADFVIRVSEGADLQRYVVTDDLKRNFDDALSMIAHAVQTGRSQAKFLHGSFGSGKSHFMAVLREILRHNPEARAVRGLAEPIDKSDPALKGRKFLTLTFHMLDARSVEQAILEGYLRQIRQLHPEAPIPAVHRSDALLADAARLRKRMGDEQFFAALGGGVAGGGSGAGLAAEMASGGDWTAETYAQAAAEPPGTPLRDELVSALTTSFFSGAVQSSEYLDFDTGLAVITRHAKTLGYDAMVLFLDELILWLSTKIADHTFVQTEGAKLNKLVESSDAARPLPIVSFVARQRNLEEFLGPQVGGTERAALADVMRSVQGRLGQDIVLADTNLPEITEKRLLKPYNDAAKAVIDDAFAAVRNRRDVWDTLLLGAQYGDAGIGSDAAAFRRLYPFSPALVATLVALSQALQRERTALKVMTELLVERRDTLQVNDLIGVSALFEPLVLRGELPDRPQLKHKFQKARESYLKRFRPLLLGAHGIAEEQAATHELFQVDDRLIKTLILGYLVSEVPALHNLTAAKLHALNFGSIASPLPGYENQIVLGRMRQLSADAGELHMSDGPDPVIQVDIPDDDYGVLIEMVPANETASGVLQQLIRDLVGGELGLDNQAGSYGEYPYLREWRGRKHVINVRFGNVRDRDNMPDSALIAGGDGWRVVVDYPFDPGHKRNEDFARIETLETGSRTVFWMPLFLSDDSMGRVGMLAKVSYLLSGPNGNRIDSLAADQAKAWREGAKAFFNLRQQQLKSALLTALKQAYGAAVPEPGIVEQDNIGVLHTLAEGLRVGDPRGGMLRDAFLNLTGELLTWSYPGKPALPEDEKTPARAELNKVLKYAKLAAADPTKGVAVDQADQKIIRRICNPLRLGELIDHRYVLTASTCWWSGHLTQGAARKDYTKHFPVHVLRSLLDEPEARGFDRELQNLIIAVFAEEQQLAWYQGGDATTVDVVQAIADHGMELRQIELPGETLWEAARAHAGGIFGVPVPGWLSPAAMAALAQAVRTEAARYRAAVPVLAQRLEQHSATLRLDPQASSGRLYQARKVAQMLEKLSGESDNRVLIEVLAAADFAIDDAAVGKVFKTADAVSRALADAQWSLLNAVQQRAAGGEAEAERIMQELAVNARHDAHAADLVEALRVAGNAATELIVKPTSTGGTGGSGGGSVGSGGSGGPGSSGGDGSSQGTGPGSGTDVDAGGGVGPVQTAQQRQVTNSADLAQVVDDIKRTLEAGSTVLVTWEVR